MRKRTMSLAVIYVLVVAALLPAVSGCGSSDNGSSTQANQTQVPFIPTNDVQYIDAIVPHHQKAIQMADMEIQKGTRDNVKAMAQQMKTAQAAEITLLQNARQQLTGSATVPPPPTDPHMEQDMTLLNAATGAQVDALFLEHMIPHHAEGISIAHRALPNLTRQDVRDNATNVENTQAREIGEMQAMKP